MKDYLRKAKHNENFLAVLEKSFPNEFYDWKIVVIFYIAVHYIEAYFDSHGIKTTNHKQRRELIEFGEFSFLRSFIDNYDNLFNICHISRYNGFKNFEAFNAHQKEKLKEAKKNLKVIRDTIIDDLDQIQD